MSDPNFLLNAPDGIARYEALQELRHGDPAVVIPRLVCLLEEGSARYPDEIMDVIASVGGADTLRDLLDHPSLGSRARQALTRLEEEAARAASAPPRAATTSRPVTPPQPKAPGETLIPYLWSSVKSDQAKHHRKLVEIGAPAIPALVRALNDPRLRRRAAVLWVLKDIGGPEALAAIRAACDDPDPSVAKPANVVLKQIEQAES